MKPIPKDRLFVQVRYEDLLDKMWLIALFKINCEVYVSPERIDSCREVDLNRIKGIMDKRGLERRMHAPVYAGCENTVEHLEESYRKSSLFCRSLGMDTIVMHAEDGSDVRVWKDMSASAERDGLRILLENHYESSAEPVVEIIKAVDSDNLKACFDVAHFFAFGKKEVASYLDDYPEGSIREIHLSDNLGDADAHLELGKGKLDFPVFFEAVEERKIDAVYTIEAKDIWGIMGGINYLKKIGGL